MSTLELGLTWSKRWHLVADDASRMADERNSFTAEPICHQATYVYLLGHKLPSHLVAAQQRAEPLPTCKWCWKRAERMGLEIPSVPGGAG